jgi:predicted nucleic acid-binding protein
MNFVIDSSIALKWVIPEIDSDRALRLLVGYANAVHQLIAPDLFTVEIANALASAEKAGRIRPGEAVAFFTDITNNSPVLYTATPLLRRALEISLPTRESVYDCLYVSLAEHHGCELVTADDKLLRNLSGQFPFIIALSSLP